MRSIRRRIFGKGYFAAAAALALAAPQAEWRVAVVALLIPFYLYAKRTEHRGSFRVFGRSKADETKLFVDYYVQNYKDAKP